MWVASLVALLAGLALAVLVIVSRHMPAVDALHYRARIRSEEIRRVAEARQQIAAAQAVAESAVDGGTAAVRLIHKGIAAIPFTILENIPATRDTTRQVRRIHDAISDGVYAGISIGNKLIGHAARSGINAPKADASKIEKDKLKLDSPGSGAAPLPKPPSNEK